MPVVTAVVMMGSAIKIPTTTGTVLDVNHNMTIRMTATTGVERMSESGTSNTFFIKSELPHSKPRAVPKLSDIKKAAKTRRTVNPKEIQNSFFVTKEQKAFKTSGGYGRINGASIMAAVIIQTAKMSTTESVMLITFFIIVKSLVRQFSTY